MRVKVVGCFYRGAPSLVFEVILNATVSETSTTWAAQENFELPLPPSSLEFTPNTKQ